MLKKLYLTISMLFVVLGTSVAAAVPVYAAGCPEAVFGITTWYRGLPKTDGCNVKPFDKDGGADMAKTAVVVALNLVQAGLAIATYVTIFYIIKGGFNFMTSRGSSDGLAAAKKTVANAVIGLFIAVLSAAIVGAIAGMLTV